MSTKNGLGNNYNKKDVHRTAVTSVPRFAADVVRAPLLKPSWRTDHLARHFRPCCTAVAAAAAAVTGSRSRLSDGYREKSSVDD